MAKSFGLGRGLSSLIPTQSDNKEEINEIDKKSLDINDISDYDNAKEIKQISLQEIIVADWQPRQRFDNESLNELASSIIKHGILEPLLVTPLNNGKYKLIAGERRFKAAKIANLHSVPVIVKSVSEQEHLEISLIENIQRSDLNPVDEARAYQKLINDFSLTQEEVSNRVGKSRSQIANYLRILKLPSEILDLLANKKISVGHAKLILEIKDKNKQIKLAKKIAKENISVRNIAHKIKIKKASSFDFTTNRLKEMQVILADFLKTKVKIKPTGSTGKGVIEIEYYSDEDLDALMEKIGLK